MSTTERPIVVGVTGDSVRRCRESLDWAAAEARLHCRPIHLVHGAHPDTGWPGSRWREPSAEGLQPLLRHGRHLLNDARRYLTRSTEIEVEITTTNSSESGVDALVTAAETASLLVLQRRHHTVWHQLSTASVMEAVAAEALCPVVVVPAEGPVTQHEDGGLGVVVGVGSNGRSSHAVFTAAQEAVWRGVPLTLVHAWDVPGDVPSYMRADAEEIALHRSRADHDLSLADAAVRGACPELTIDRISTRGATVQVLTAASARAELVVLSRHTTSTLTWRALGRTTRHLLRHSRSPVCVTSPVVTADERDRAVTTSLWPSVIPSPARRPTTTPTGARP